VPPLTRPRPKCWQGPSLENSAAIVVAGEGWHPGIAGLIASRLKEKFRRPAFAIAFDTNAIGNRVRPLDFGCRSRPCGARAVDTGILAKAAACDGGWHHSRAGTAQRFQGIPRSKLAAPVAAARSGETLLIDAALTAAGANPALLVGIARGGPMARSNPEPVFALPAHRLLDVVNVGNGHVRLARGGRRWKQIDGIAFRRRRRAAGQALHARETPPFILREPWRRIARR